jgi:hypothetical protein
MDHQLYYGKPLTSPELRCDMTRECRSVVTHVDNQGYVYCRHHGVQRRGGGIRVRQLTATEAQDLRDGNTIKY